MSQRIRPPISDGVSETMSEAPATPMSRVATWTMWAAVLALTALPLMWVSKAPANASGAEGELFEGADSRAQQAITQIAPDYKPWFSPVLEPSSNEIASLLFALQAAAGAGVIGYWLGLSRARAAAAKAATAGHVVGTATATDNTADAVDAAAELRISVAHDRRPDVDAEGMPSPTQNGRREH
ncbi:energy-coupling factor ABC transporter substrate-binding protein [Roseateles sp. SL47]|uniref:energy-coupling factor ABC transporter substrate-binding protein n=1 Tax=Roseateles sp. SL47 TaxID=2995138 RepID=UPI002271B721|nr:energy-coupling factor ABC transporter substrate-binding protein [Roseateles sp. SL47]WAC73476.1 energy-coupling factor ABC transporter substrate-binding protein [Roseateles sp. SL47]